jgi:hypothetical protein
MQVNWEYISHFKNVLEIDVTRIKEQKGETF